MAFESAINTDESGTEEDKARDLAARDLVARRAASQFARPRTWRGLLQLATSFGPFIAGCAAMYLVMPYSTLLALLLALPTGALLLRVFIVQHDCGHGSFLPSRRANALVGRLCSLITLTPYANWARQHSLHHAAWNDLDRPGGSDIYSSCITVRAYLALSPRARLLYRLARHPLVANLLVPPLVFLLLYRTPFETPRAWTRERWSVYLTNAALVALFGTLVAVLGWRSVLLIHVTVIAVSSILGVWLFTLQHRFATAHWTGRDAWNFVPAALDGASWFDLPRVLHWLTGNIGFHHIHHLDQRVPNYRLRAAHETVQALRPVTRLGLAGGLTAPLLTLWDESAGRLVSFRDVARVVRQTPA